MTLISYYSCPFQVTDLEMRRVAKELEKQERKNRNKRQKQQPDAG